MDIRTEYVPHLYSNKKGINSSPIFPLKRSSVRPNRGEVGSRCTQPKTELNRTSNYQMKVQRSHQLVLGRHDGNTNCQSVAINTILTRGDTTLHVLSSCDKKGRLSSQNGFKFNISYRRYANLQWNSYNRFEARKFKKIKTSNFSTVVWTSNSMGIQVFWQNFYWPKERITLP